MEVSRRRFLNSAACVAAALKGMAFPTPEAAGTPEMPYSEAQTGAQNPRWRGDIPSFEPPYRHSLHRQFGAYSHDDANWYRLRDGLDFARIRAYSDGKPADSLAVVRADPERNRFRYFHDRKRLRTIEEWQDATGAEVVVNGTRYRYAMSNARTISSVEPVALIISDGKFSGPKANKAAEGMFVAEPSDNKKPLARIIDMSREHYDHQHSIWNTGVQSWPVLLHEDGSVTARAGHFYVYGKNAPPWATARDWYANRNVIADDREGNILLMTTEGGLFSYRELGRFLRESKLNVRRALNLDGGYEADMCVETPRLRYVTYGQWETQGKRDISSPGLKIAIPAVVAVFPR